MSSNIELAFSAIFILMAPLLLHLGALRGADFYPQEPTGKPFVDAILYKWLKPIIFTNGVLLSLAFLFWRLLDARLWTVPLIFVIPLTLLQSVALIISKFKDIKKG
ncbi:MAG: hypothetical protein WCO11_12150 [Sphingomonadales bacterium]|jgi:hypothetical protein